MKIMEDQFPISLGSIIIGSLAMVVGLDGVALTMVRGLVVTGLTVIGSIRVALDARAGATSIRASTVATPSEGFSLDFPSSKN